MPNAATALLPLVTQPVSVRTQGPWPGQHSVLLPRGGTDRPSQLSSGWESFCRSGGKPVVGPQGQKKGFPPFPEQTHAPGKYLPSTDVPGPVLGTVDTVYTRPRGATISVGETEQLVKYSV